MHLKRIPLKRRHSWQILILYTSFKLKTSWKCLGKKYITQKKNITSDSENLSEYCSKIENEGIGSSSESELESGYLNESFQGMKLETWQCEPLKKNSSSENLFIDSAKITESEGSISPSTFYGQQLITSF